MKVGARDWEKQENTKTKKQKERRKKREKQEGEKGISTKLKPLRTNRWGGGGLPECLDSVVSSGLPE